ncbi:molecular chaperone DnaJ [Micromonosporaceae bacterium Da 78-11]
MPTFEEAVARIDAAASFAELMTGQGAKGTKGTAADRAETAYREWVKVVHPDAVGAARNAAANRAFAKLSGLFQERDGRVLRTPKGSYRIGAVIAKGDIADLSAVDGDVALLKAPRSPGDNDLMAAEAAALQRLWTDGDPKYRPYAPRLIESFVHEDADRKRRTVNVIERQRGFVPLSRVHHLDPRDAAWMWRRLLVGLGWAHRAGVVHGAVLAEHTLIHPAEHGLVLVDWCYSGTRPTAIVAAQRDAYPPEVLRDKSATSATDIYMATGLMQRLIGAGMPKALRRFADGCRYDAPRMRPQDAWALLGELDDLLHDLYGPRTFRPFHL